MNDIYELMQGAYIDIRAGTKKTAQYWIARFPFLTQEDLDNKPKWFRKVEDKEHTDSDMKKLIDFYKSIKDVMIHPLSSQEIVNEWKKQRDD